MQGRSCRLYIRVLKCGISNCPNLNRIEISWLLIQSAPCLVASRPTKASKPAAGVLSWELKTKPSQVIRLLTVSRETRASIFRWLGTLLEYSIAPTDRSARLFGEPTREWIVIVLFKLSISVVVTFFSVLPPAAAENSLALLCYHCVCIVCDRTLEVFCSIAIRSAVCLRWVGI